VGPNPRGRNIGTAQIRKTVAGKTDPLLAAVPDPFVMQVTHMQAVLTLPPLAVHLAAHDCDPFHSFRVGDRAWGVQFHPEFDARTLRAYIEGRRDAMVAEGLDPDALLASTRDSNHGTRLLRRFADLLA
jgi:GMP synthase (glutamine-hydrolysing)